MPDRTSHHALVLCGLCLAPLPALAADFTITTDTAITNGGFVIAPTDTLTATSGITMTMPPGVHAMASAAASVTVTNNGTISVSDTGIGISLSGVSSVAVNNGLIVANGEGAGGISMLASSADALNTGTIRVAGGGGPAVYFDQNTTRFRNTGRLAASFGVALDFAGAENALLLDVGSHVEGAMILGGSTFVTIATGAANSLDFSFTGVPWFSMTVTGTVPHVVDVAGQRVASIDPTQFSAMQTGMTDSASQVFGAIGLHSEGVLAGGGADVRVSSRTGQPAPDAAIPGPGWANAYGTASRYSASGNNLAYATGQAGIIAGVDLSRRAGRVFGIAVGGGQMQFGADGIFQRSHRIQSRAVFVSAYGAWQIGNAVLDVGPTGAMQRHDSQRAINNNLAPGGIDTGIAEYNSHFIAPSVSVRRSFVLGSGDNLVLTTRAALGITAGVVDAYSETASLGTASFAARAFSIGTGSADVELARSFGDTVMTGRLGIAAETAFGNEAISGTLLGLPWTYDAGSGAGFAGQVGLTVDHRFGARFVGQIAAQSSFGSAGLASTKGSASLRVEF
ncbi:MAG: autotransporter outer membrane beta-barrel domain-containing protein [Rhodobacteraceae bacterium]|nr:autotransporter outer membrane beta-barrel domain-containing protein [Paracoccaceae bacterium]